jgi:hypothetical protein
LQEDERALALNIERLILVLPCKYRFEEERDQLQAKISTLEQQVHDLNETRESLQLLVQKLQNEVVALKSDIRRHLDDKKKALEEIVRPISLTTTARSHYYVHLRANGYGVAERTEVFGDFTSSSNIWC